MRDSTYKDIRLKLRKVELNNITPYIDSLNLRGMVNGDLNIYQKGNMYKPNLNVLIKDFMVNDTRYGNLKLDADGNKDLSDFDIKAYLSDQQKNYITAKGKIKTTNGQQFIDVDAELNDLDISSLSPLGAEVISRLRGKVTGKAKLEGLLNNPDLKGKLDLKNAGLKFPYLNVDFDFDKDAQVT
jgi:autotransporter translocation and assembly factor TamB